MREIKWQLKEIFTFPQSSGKPVAIKQVQVTPRYEVVEENEITSLQGVYDMTAQVTFEHNPNSKIETLGAIEIIDIELPEGKFTYAAPFTIDLPMDAQGPFYLTTNKATAHMNEDGQVEVIWDVHCSYKEVVMLTEKRSHLNEGLSFVTSFVDNESKAVLHTDDILVKRES